MGLLLRDTIVKAVNGKKNKWFIPQNLYLSLMKQLIKKILRESVGVPEGIYETSVEIYKEILSELEEILPPYNEEKELFIRFNNKDLKVGDMVVNFIRLRLELIEREEIETPTLGRMAFSQSSEIERTRLINIHNEGKLSMVLGILLPEDSTKEDIIGLVKDEKNMIISSISHELKHAYDFYKKGYSKIGEVADYGSIMKISFGLHPINKFIHYLYFTHNIENLVRASELYSLSQEYGITQKDFYDFLKNTDLFKMLKQIESFSYENLKKELLDYIDKIDYIFERINLPTNLTDEEKVDEILRILYINITNGKLEIIHNYLSPDITEIIFGIDEEKANFFDKLTKIATKFVGKEKNFYLYEEKRMKTVARNMIKKIAKVYSLLKQQTNETIFDWDLYQKYFVKETKIDTEIKYKRK